MGEAGHTVTLLSLGEGSFEVAPANLPAAFAWTPGIDRVRVRRLKPERGVARVTMPGATARIEELVADTDVVHLHGVWDPILLRVSQIAAARGVPYVVRPAGMLDPWSLRQKWVKKKVALALGYRRMLEGAAFIQALNADERDLIARLRLPTPTEVIANGTFEQWINAPKQRGRFRANHPIVGNRPMVLFLSRLHYKKGLDYLADAFAIVLKSIPDALLVVAGPNEGAEEAFGAQIGRLGISQSVILTGPIFAQEKVDAIVDADCFCLPSRQEGFSVAVIESLAMGTPVVISPACHFPEVDEVGAGETVPLKAEAIGDALVRMLSDPIARARQSQAGVELIRKKYTWPKIAEACVAAYMRHAKRGPETAARRYPHG